MCVQSSQLHCTFKRRCLPQLKNNREGDVDLFIPDARIKSNLGRFSASTTVTRRSPRDSLTSFGAFFCAAACLAMRACKSYQDQECAQAFHWLLLTYEEARTCILDTCKHESMCASTRECVRTAATINLFMILPSPCSSAIFCCMHMKTYTRTHISQTPVWTLVRCAATDARTPPPRAVACGPSTAQQSDQSCTSTYKHMSS